jgi:hypothetical protein
VSFKENFRLWRTCTSHFQGWQVYVYIFSVYLYTEYRYRNPLSRFTLIPTHTPFERPSADYSQRRSYNLTRRVEFIDNFSLTHSFIHSFHTFYNLHFLISMVNCVFLMIFAFHSLSPAVDVCCLPKYEYICRFSVREPARKRLIWCPASWSSRLQPE